MIVVSDTNIHIEDSYLIRGRYFSSILREIECEVTERRSMFSLKKEWAVHNFLYKIGYKRERTKDVDLDYPCDKPEWVYEVLGSLVWIFVR